MEQSPFKLFPQLLGIREPRRKPEWIYKLQWKQVNFCLFPTLSLPMVQLLTWGARFVVIKMCISAGECQVLNAVYIFWIWASPYSLIPLIPLAVPCAPLPAAWVTFVEGWNSQPVNRERTEQANLCPRSPHFNLKSKYLTLTYCNEPMQNVGINTIIFQYSVKCRIFCPSFQSMTF